MGTRPHGRLAAFVAVGLLFGSLSGCTDGAAPEVSPNFPLEGEGGKTDIFGRALAGVAAPYPADDSLADREEELHTNIAERRATGWEILQRALEPVPLLGLAERIEDTEDLMLPEGEVPTVPRFQTWYGVDDFKRMFQGLYESQIRPDRLRREPFSDEDLDEAEVANANAIDRSSRWPLERFLRYVNQLGICEEGLPEDECARRLQSGFSGSSAGNIRITYAPATIRHLLENYGSILDCMEELDTLDMNAEPEDEANFSFCYQQEMPTDAVLVKAQWARVLGDREMPVYDTGADALGEILGSNNSGTWPEDGHGTANPGDEDIVTIRLRSGATYRLVGLHVMTKELRHWTWVTMWWSDTPNLDFGEDRPASFGDLDPVWSNYKMCIVTDYQEGDDDPAASLGDYPSLAAAMGSMPPGASWCSNPYVEEGRGNARTNCIGCHQHGGATVGADLNGDEVPDALDLVQVIDDDERYPFNGRIRQRDVFPSDYLWSSSRVDNLFQVVRSEVNRQDVSDGREIDSRIERVVELPGDETAGASIFAANCAECHGDDGTGDFGPNLFDRVPMRDQETLALRILLGIGPMPAWDNEFSDQEIADLMTFLRATFDAPEM